MVVFADRIDAGQQLARELERLCIEDPVILGLPRGGVPVAFEVARVLAAPLDVIVVRKLGVPSQPELAIGAIGENDVQVLNRNIIALAGVSQEELGAVQARERSLLEARVACLRPGGARTDLAGRTVVIVDDGIATGSTARAACRVARQLGAAKIIVAVPVAPAKTLKNFAEADALACVSAPESFSAVGAHYRDFTATTDDEVMVLLDLARRNLADRRFG